jgi:hypothetical protein
MSVPAQIDIQSWNESDMFMRTQSLTFHKLKEFAVTEDSMRKRQRTIERFRFGSCDFSCELSLTKACCY